MVKVKYKEISPELESLVKPNFGFRGRVSLGKESLVNEYHFLHIDSLIPFKKQARKIFNKEEIDELSDTIKQYGIRQPLSVIVSKTEEGKYEIISGERRFRAAKQVGLERIPCIICEEKQDIYEEVALIENIQRKDLHPVEMASALRNLIDEKSYGDVKFLSEKLGVTYSKISETLKLNELPDKIKNILLEKDIKSRAIFRALAKCDDEKKMLKLLGVGDAESDEIVPRARNVIHVTTKSGKLDFIFDYKRLDELQRAELKAKLINLVEQL